MAELRNAILACGCKTKMVIRLMNFSQLANVLDLHFQGQTFEILVFCCNFETVAQRTINVGRRVHVDKEIYVVKRQPVFTTFIIKINLWNFYIFSLYKFAVGKVCHKCFGLCVLIL